MSLRMRKSWSLCALGMLACAADFETNGAEDSENVARASQRIVLSSTANCTVELTKIDYDQVGADSNDYIELKVTKTGGGLVSTLTDCGIGAIALYDDSSVISPGVCIPYSITALANVAIPSDGYIEVGQGAGSTVAATIALGSGADGWIHNGRGEIAVVSAALPDGIPTSWFQYEGTAKCDLLGLPVAQIPTENDGSPNFTNVSCDSTFHLVNSANALPKTNADCPTGGAGGAGGAGNAGGNANMAGSAGLSGSGGTLNLGGIGGLLNLGGLGGLLNLGGLSNSGGNGGALSNGGSAGAPSFAGNAGVGNASGSSAAPNGGAGGSGAAAGEADTSTAGASGSSTTSSDAGEAGEANAAQGGTHTGAGGSSSGANAGKAGSGETTGESGHPGHGVVTQGGGCSCSVPNAPNGGRTHALIALATLLGTGLRRRRRSSN